MKNEHPLIQDMNPKNLRISPDMVSSSTDLASPEKRIFDKDWINLRKSIISFGKVLRPIKVYYDEANDNYLVLTGYRRWQIALEFEFDTIPVVIITEKSSEKRREISFMDNMTPVPNNIFTKYQ
jgi:hypothetical protein